MACYVLQTQTVEFGLKNIIFLEKYFKKNNISFRTTKDKAGETMAIYFDSMVIDLKAQKATIPEGWNSRLNEVKRGYSQMVIEEIANKKKWLIKKTGENQMALRRY